MVYIETSVVRFRIPVEPKLATTVCDYHSPHSIGVNWDTNDNAEVNAESGVDVSVGRTRELQ